jgi:hypothetical protein
MPMKSIYAPQEGIFTAQRCWVNYGSRYARGSGSILDPAISRDRGDIEETPFIPSYALDLPAV